MRQHFAFACGRVWVVMTKFAIVSASILLPGLPQQPQRDRGGLNSCVRTWLHHAKAKSRTPAAGTLSCDAILPILLSNSQREFIVCVSSKTVIESRMSFGFGACNSGRIAATSLVPNDNVRAPSSKIEDHQNRATVECKLAKQKVLNGCPPHGCSQDSDYQSFLLKPHHHV